MSEKEKETGEIEERDGFIAIPDGSLYYKKYDIQGKVRDFRWCSFMEIGALTGIFLLI